MALMFMCFLLLPTRWLLISPINNSIRMKMAQCPDGNSVINIIPDYEAHFSATKPPGCTFTPPSSATSIFVPYSILVSDRGALELWVFHLHVKTSPGPGCKGPNLEWQSSVRDSWSTKQGWLSSSSQSPAAPLTNTTSIQQADREILPHAFACRLWEIENYVYFYGFCFITKLLHVQCSEKKLALCFSKQILMFDNNNLS